MEGYTHDELMKICEKMSLYGGSFAHALATAFIKADNSNRERLIKAFPEYFARYKEM